MANTTKKRKQPSKWQQGVQNQAGVERGVGGGFKLDEAKIKEGENQAKDKDKQTAQLQTSKIHKTRRQAGGYIINYMCIDISTYNNWCWTFVSLWGLESSS